MVRTMRAWPNSNIKPGSWSEEANTEGTHLTHVMGIIDAIRAQALDMGWLGSLGQRIGSR